MAHERYGVEVSYRDLTYAAIQGMMRILDPHTSFLTPESYDNMRERQQGSFYGLGILVSKRSGQLTVISPIEGTPASRLGLRSGDVIHTIEGEPTDTMTLDEAVRKLKGPKGTEVRITIVRGGLDESLALSITRAEIPQETVRYAYMMTPEVGYLRLTDFSRSTAGEMQEALAKLRREGMKRLLLDLRSNGGGLLDQVVLVADEFLPAQSEIVETRGRLADLQQVYLDDGGDPDPELAMPLVVLVNNGTASAAEILAGAIQDHDVGLIVGVPTWGKGLVQTVYNLSFGTGIALTTAKYHTPSGRLIQRDYSSYYDYYNRFDQDADPADEPGRKEFLTGLGRTVYGGGGITPDILVEFPDGPVGLQPLFANNAFFNFAVDYHGRQPVTSQTWRPGEEILDEFSTWLGEQKIVGEKIEAAMTDNAAREFTRRQIHSDIFTAAFGVEAAHRVLATGDVQIQAAMELFDEAANLLSRRSLLDNTAVERAPGSGTAGTGEPGKPPSSGAETPAPQTRYWPPELQAADRFTQAKYLADSGSFEEAEEAYREMIELDGSNAYGRIELAKFQSHLAKISRSDEKRVGYLEAAAAEAKVARDLAPGDPTILSAFAQIHLRLGEHEVAAFDLAQEAYETLRAETPGDLQVLTPLGQIYLWKGEPERAVEVLREAKSHRPGHEMIESMLLDALFSAGRLDEVEVVLEEFIGRWPDAEARRLQLAELYSERGDHRHAAKVLLEAPPSRQPQPATRRTLAQELHLAGVNDEALEIVDGLLSETPSPDLRRLRVAILSGQLRYGEAIEELETLLAAEADTERSKQDMFLHSRLLERSGRSKEAIVRLRALAGGSSGPLDLRAAMSLAGALERDGRIEEAATLLGEKMEEATDELALPVGQELIRLLLDSERGDEALVVAERMVERAASTGGEAAARAALSRLAILERAEQWDRIAELAPQLFGAPTVQLRERAYAYDAQALAQRGLVDEALARLEEGGRALGSRRLFSDRVEILFAHGRSEQALALLEGVIASGTVADLLFAAEIHQSGERWEQAIRLVERALEQEPSSIQALFVLGAACERAGRRERSIEIFRRLLALDPEHTPTLNYLGYMWAERGENLEEALDMLRRSVAHDPDNGAYVDSLGWAYFQLGDHDEAQQRLEWAARLLPDDATTLEHLGDLYVRLQNLVRARDFYRRVLDLGEVENDDNVRRKLQALSE